MCFAPDLAVEVVSPNDSDKDIARKVREYLQYGTRMVVVVYPDSRKVAVHSPTGRQTLTEDGTLDGGDVLPGLKLAVRDIFSRRAN
jgi:Uma2 family endonuclease